MDDELGDDADYAAALDATERAFTSRGTAAERRPLPHAPTAGRVQQPKPQALPARQGTSHILVSTAQKGNPVLEKIQGIPWEWADIPADYVVGNTTCVLFLQLKYHRIRPGYIDGRISKLGHKYNLRVLLVLVDIPNHEDSLRSLSKTCLVYDLTLIVSWSASEAARYLELFKSHEHSSAGSIRGQQATTASEKLVEFITLPRSINKADAVGLLGNFGTLQAAVTARPEEIDLVAGWGERKVQQWCGSVREPFRVRRAARRGATISRDASRADADVDAVEEDEDEDERGSMSPVPDVALLQSKTATRIAEVEAEAEAEADWEPGADEEEAMLEASTAIAITTTAQNPDTDQQRRKQSRDGEVSEGVLAALARLRDTGS
ncbi:MAG: ssDNA endonuclease and repair protein rad10 [Thelocarpon superellum]|nr:MAG: ssDNA endonuclease and repair protein rad10 [Thelocarpon superellum]